MDMNTTLRQMQLGNEHNVQSSSVKIKNKTSIQSNRPATRRAIMPAFVPISLACKGNTKCQGKYSSNSRIITAALVCPSSQNETTTQGSGAWLMRRQRSRNTVQTQPEYVNCAALMRSVRVKFFLLLFKHSLHQAAL